MKYIALFLIAATAAFAQVKENVPVGSNLTLLATADGYPAPRLEWYKNGVKVADSPAPTDPLANGPREYRYEIGIVGITTAGTYTAKAINSEGSATSDPYIITTNFAPTKPTIKIVAKQPGTVTVEVQPGVKVIQSTSVK
jgi:hypothetical protein